MHIHYNQAELLVHARRSLYMHSVWVEKQIEIYSLFIGKNAWNMLKPLENQVAFLKKIFGHMSRMQMPMVLNA